MTNQKILAGASTLLALGLFNTGANAAIELPDTFEGKAYGQLNQVVLFADDGETSESFIADNANSGTRLGVTGSAKVDDEISIGMRIEAGWSRNPSNHMDMETRNEAADWVERHFDFFVSGPFGKVSAGMGDGATNGYTESDLSGTLLAVFTSPSALLGGFKFQDNGVYGPKISQTTDHQDFESRNDRVRYDTPAFAGTSISVSSGVKSSNDLFEIGLKSDQQFGDGGKLKFTVGYSAEDKDTVAGTEETIGGSLSYLAANGFNITLIASTKTDDDPANPDADYRAIKLGYKTGKHSSAIIYGKGYDQHMEGDDSDYISVGYVYKAAKWAELYASYNLISLDRAGSNFDDINAIALGGRIKF